MPSSETNEAEARPRLRRRGVSTSLLAALLPIAFIAGLALGYLAWGRNSKGNAQQANPAAGDELATPKAIKRYKVTEGNIPSQGPANAKITIVEFSDYECPYCTKWQQEVWPELQKAFPNQIRLVYRDFPLYGLHDNAAPAAEAARCANEQGKYWEFHDLLFSDKARLGQDTFLSYASQLGLDTTKFKDCLTSRRYKSAVEQDYTYAAQLGVQSTPTFFVNGMAMIGAQPFEAFQQLIQKELAGQNPQ